MPKLNQSRSELNLNQTQRVNIDLDFTLSVLNCTNMLLFFVINQSRFITVWRLIFKNFITLLFQTVKDRNSEYTQTKNCAFLHHLYAASELKAVVWLSHREFSLMEVFCGNRRTEAEVPRVVYILKKLIGRCCFCFCSFALGLKKKKTEHKVTRREPTS